jgi:hypothetical protein
MCELVRRKGNRNAAYVSRETVLPGFADKTLTQRQRFG